VAVSGQPTLTTLVESAYKGNPNLQVAGLRVMQTQAQLNIATGAQYPQQQALSGSYTYRNRDTGLLNSETDIVSRQIGLGATWEIDFWGKYRRNIRRIRVPCSVPRLAMTMRLSPWSPVLPTPLSPFAR
jgi:outer membrane protein TolC